MLRTVQTADVPIFFEQQLDEEASHMAAFTSADPTARSAFSDFWARIRADQTVVLRTIVDEGEVAGYIASYLHDHERVVGFWIGKSFWGRGIATRALRSFLRELTVRPLYGRAAEDNRGSIRVLEKCGFELYGRERNFANARGEDVDEVVLRLGRSVVG